MTRRARIIDPEIQLWPMLSYHYGLSYSELRQMPRMFVRLYVESLPELLAEDQLRALGAAAYPHLKRGEQQRMLRELRKQTRSRRRAERARTAEEMAANAQSLGIQFVIEGQDDDERYDQSVKTDE